MHYRVGYLFEGGNSGPGSEPEAARRATGGIPIPDVPGVPPPPRRGSSTRRWVFIGLGGCAGLIVLLLVVVIGCAAILGSIGGGGGGDEPNPQDQPAAAIGETVAVGDVAWTVTDAKEANRLTAEFANPLQGDFVIVNFDFKNNGSEPVTLDNQSLALIDSEGNKSQADSNKFQYLPKDRNIFLQRINLGVSQQGQAIFTVASDASGFKLQAGDTAALSDENGYVDLGF